MTPAEVPAELVEAAERTLAFSICADNRPDGKCDCPTDEQIRVVLAAVLPRDREAVLGGARKALQAAYKRGPGNTRLNGRGEAWRKGVSLAHRIVRDYERSMRAEGGEGAS
jgi:hypothetical protein